MNCRIVNVLRSGSCQAVLIAFGPASSLQGNEDEEEEDDDDNDEVLETCTLQAAAIRHRL